MLNNKSIGIATVAISLILLSFQNCGQPGSISTSGGIQSISQSSPSPTEDTTSIPTPAEPIEPVPEVVAENYGNFIGVTTGVGFSCGINENGDVWCFGNNNFGTLGNGTTVQSNTMVKVKSLDKPAKRIFASSIWSICALLIDGSVKCWGRNYAGQLGDGTTNDSHVPIAVTGLVEPAVDISVSDAGCAVLQSGRAQCWGLYKSPDLYQAHDGGKILSIGGGNNVMCFLTDKKNIECKSSNNEYGVLGDGTQSLSMSFKLVADLSGKAIDLAVSQENICALLIDGSVSCWGNNRFGSLGNGKTKEEVSFATSPHPVLGLTEKLIKISASGGYHTCGISESGSVYCWGMIFGQNHSSAFKVNGLADIVEISASNASTCFLGSNKRFRCVGSYKSVGTSTLSDDY